MGEIVPDPRDKVQAAVTAAEVLKALGRHGIPAPLSRIANSARIAPAKAHRYLQALIETGLAVQDPRTGHYGLGSEMVVMGAAALGRLDLVQVATEPMMALRETTGATCLLSVWSNHGPTAVRVLQSLSPITVVTKLGSVLPLRSATGLVFAAHLPEAELRAAQDYKSLLNSEIDGVAIVLEQIRRRGVTNISGLVVAGIDAVAAPVFTADGSCAGVLCSLGPAPAFDASLEGQTALAVHDHAALISNSLGYRPEATLA